MFQPNTLYFTDGYKVGHNKMLPPGVLKFYGTWIPRSLKYAGKGIKKIVSMGQQLTWKWLHDEFEEHFFKLNWSEAEQFGKDMALYLGMSYDYRHFKDLHNLQYLPIRVKSLKEGIETLPGIPHMTFINTIDGYAWLTLYLETIVSSLSWKTSTSATIALQYRRNVADWVKETDPANSWLIPFLCHDFSARGLDPFSMIASGLGHASSFRGSDSLIVIPAARYFYGESRDEVCINSVNASEHSVTCTGIFYYEDKLRKGLLNDRIKEYYSFIAPSEGSVEEPDYMAISEWLNLRDWLAKFPEGILSVVSDTFNLWKLITFILPRLKEEIMARSGKVVVRPDSGDPVNIICGADFKTFPDIANPEAPQSKGVIELLWDTFGGTVNEQGYKVLDSHIGAIYGDSITLERQLDIYKRLAGKGYACTNVVLGVGSYTYQYNTRDTNGWAAKGAWFCTAHEEYDIYKDPVTDNGTKKSLKGRVAVYLDEKGEYFVKEQCTDEMEESGELQLIYEDGKFFNQTTLSTIRKRIDVLVDMEQLETISF